MTIKTPTKPDSVKNNALNILIVSGLVALGPFAMEAYLPAVPIIAENLNTNIENVNITISTFLFGLGIGQFIGGPISDQIGRQRNILYGLSVFFVLSLLTVFVNNIVWLQLLRLLQALSCGFATVVAIPILSDLYPPDIASRKIPTVTSVMFIAPLLAPLLGTTLLALWSWHIIFVAIAIYSLIIVSLFYHKIGETNAKNIQNSFSMKETLKQCLSR